MNKDFDGGHRVWKNHDKNSNREREQIQEVLQQQENHQKDPFVFFVNHE